MIRLIFLSVVMLSGCSSAETKPTCAGAITCSDVVGDYNRLIQAEFVICQGASIGAIQRLYGYGAKYKARQMFCLTPNQFAPTIEYQSYPDTLIVK